MIDVIQAIAAAKTRAKEWLGEDRFLLEEVESDDRTFRITLSFPSRLAGTARSKLAAMVDPTEPREFKSFEVDKNSGEVKAMAIRQVG